jgi:O-antigen/teichoic acid export membrane protein
VPRKYFEHRWVRVLRISQSGKAASVLVTLGTFGNALSKWFLLWLFARVSGGAEAVGVYSLILAVGTPIFVVAQLGLRTIFVSHEKRWPWSSYLVLRFVGVILGALALLLFGLFAPSLPFTLVIAIMLLKVADSIRDLYSARLQYFNQMGTIGAVSVLSAVCTIAVSTVAVYVFGSIVAAVTSAALISAVLCLVTAIMAKRYEYRPSAVDNGYQGILRSGFSVTLSHLFATLFVQIPIFVVGGIAGPEILGIFAAAVYLLTISNLFGSTIQVILLTRFRLLREVQGVEGVVRKASEVSRGVLIIGILCVVPVVLFGSDILEFVYGSSFSMQFGPLLLLGLASLITVVGYVYSVTLSVLNRYMEVTWSFVVGCIASVLVGAGGAWGGFDPLLLGTATAFAGASARFLVMALLTFSVVKKAA